MSLKVAFAAVTLVGLLYIGWFFFWLPVANSSVPWLARISSESYVLLYADWMEELDETAPLNELYIANAEFWCGRRCNLAMPWSWWRFIERDPNEHARVMFESGDSYYLGLRGFIGYTPGVDLDMACLEEWNQVRYIKGTTHGQVTEELARFNDAASNYAKAYNTKMKDLLLELWHLGCTAKDR